MTKGEKARDYFCSGYNCSQSVAMAFANEINMTPEQIARLTIGFGGGIGRMREVCGTISGAAFVLSALYGDNDKSVVYKMVQDVSAGFKAKNGSIVCRELLGLSKQEPVSASPEARTQQYYSKRPCKELVQNAADALEDYLIQINN